MHFSKRSPWNVLGNHENFFFACLSTCISTLNSFVKVCHNIAYVYTFDTEIHELFEVKNCF